jgi:ABC-type transporter Mla subunit MlaD
MSEHVCIKADMIEMIKQDIETLKENNQEIIRLTTILEMQVEQSKERDKHIRQLSETLIVVSGYISEQKETLKKINEKMDSHETKLMEIDRKFESQAIEQLQRYSFNIVDFFKKIVPYLIGMGVLYAILNVNNIIKVLFK